MENIGDLFQEQIISLSMHPPHLAGPLIKVSMAVCVATACDSMCASGLAKSRTVLWFQGTLFGLTPGCSALSSGAPGRCILDSSKPDMFEIRGSKPGMLSKSVVMVGFELLSGM